MLKLQLSAQQKEGLQRGGGLSVLPCYRITTVAYYGASPAPPYEGRTAQEHESTRAPEHVSTNPNQVLKGEGGWAGGGEGAWKGGAGVHRASYRATA